MPGGGAVYNLLEESRERISDKEEKLSCVVIYGQRPDAAGQ
jgi:hypothetical protein